MPRLTRRTALKSAAALLTAAAAGVTPLRVAFAEAVAEKRLILVILRGGLDGLAALPPIGDPDYARARGELALTGKAPPLDGLFALHPSLETLYGLYRAKEMIALHALATPYRERSHFDAQDVLENGTAAPMRADDGWLNRALAVKPSTEPAPSAAAQGLAVGQNLPLVLRGAAPVTSWAPSVLPLPDNDTVARLMDLYSGDDLLGPALAAALDVEAVTQGMESMDGRGKGARRSDAALAETLKGAARILAAPDGPAVAVIEVGGWDTHANQGAETGVLAARLQGLDRGIALLKEELGALWQQSAMMIVTEFGRTVEVNGTRGTDHGTGAAAFLAGGAVDGGRVIADWPGLSAGARHEGRDLRPTMDLRSLFKGVLADHLAVPASALDREVFPESQSIRPLTGLISA